MTQKGESYTTGTVHYAKTVRNPAAPGGKSLTQVCGTSRQQLTHLAPTSENAVVTCKRCLTWTTEDLARVR